MPELFSLVAVAAAALAAGGVAGGRFARHGSSAASARRTSAPPDAAPAAPQDASLTVARLQADLSRLRALMQEYIEQRESTEESLRAPEARFRALVDALPVIVFQADVEGRWQYLSAAWEQVTGWPVDDALGRLMFEHVEPAHHEECTRTMALMASGGAPTSPSLLPIGTPDGATRWLEVRPSPVRDDGGTLVGCRGTMTDVTSRVEAERALQQSEERFSALVERAAYGIFRAAPGGRFLDVNPALVTMLGYPSADSLRELASMDELYVDPEEHDRWVRAVEAGERNPWFDLAWRRRDGTRVLVRLSAHAARGARGATGETLHYEGIVEDVTDRLRRESTVRRAERMASLGHTLAGVAHELNNPLAAISGFAQILIKTPLPEEDRSAIETIHREANRAARIVKDLLTFARRQESTAHHRMDVNEVVRYIADTQRYALETHGVRCLLELSDRPALILGDQAQIEQVVLNLLVNARQAVEAVMAMGNGDGRSHAVTLRTRVQGEQVVLEIGDTGAGIPHSHLPRIWDPFFTTKEEGEGTGLGLSVVHGIVGGHGGNIDVESTEGVGTVFSVSFPRHTRADTPEILEVGRVARLGATARAAIPLDVLVVDDERAILELLERYFALRGHAVVGALSGEQALRLAMQASVDVVVCDLRMPGMDGVEVIRRLQTIPGFARTRFVLSTGDSASAAVRRQIDALQLAAVVDKPYDLEALRQIVEQR
jgi:PAS domain S-box-containing protein